MAVIETWLKSDLKKPVAVVQLTGNLFSGDNGGNKIGVEVLDNGSPSTLSGGVTGYIIRADGATVVQTGTLSGNKAFIVLPESAYVVVGQVSIVIKVGTTTVGACTSYVYRTTTSVIVDPGSVVPDISELLAVIADCEAATTAANTAATAAGYVNIAMTKSGKTITITTTNRSNQQTSETLVEPSASVTKSGNVITISVTDADGTTTQTMLDPANTLAPAFDSSASYNIGDLCIKDGVLYVFTSAHTGAWSAVDVAAITFSRYLKDELNSKADAINVQIDTPASVMTFSDGADGMPMGATFEIAPVQDLHGYANPWPAGGGKNELPITEAGTTLSDVTFTVNQDGAGNLVSISTSGTASENVVFEFAKNLSISGTGKKLCGCPSGGSDSTYSLVARLNGTWMTNRDTGSGVSLSSTVDRVAIRILSGTNTNGLVFKPMIYATDGNTSDFAPYKNLCPITGWTGCKPSRTGKNLFSTEIEQGAIDSTDGQKASSSSSNHSKRIRTKDYIFLKAGTYTISCAETLQAIVLLYGLDKTYITPYGGTPGNISFTNLPMTITLDADYYMMFACKYSNNGAITPSNMTNVQIEMNSSATAYNTPSCVTLPISFPAGAGTVFGATLTVNKDGSGVFRNTHLLVQMDGVTSGRKVTSKGGSGNNYYYERSANSTFGIGKSKWVPMNVLLENNVKSNMFPTGDPATLVSTATFLGAYIGSNGNYQPRFSFDPTVFPNITTVETANAWFAEQYNNGTPVTQILVNKNATVYNLTAEEVGQILSLKGMNNLFCDTGNVLSVDYIEDTTLCVNHLKDTANKTEATLFDGQTDIITSYISKTSNAVTNNGDGTFTIGTTDYGSIVFKKMVLRPGTYRLFGVPVGYSYLATTGNVADAFIKNSASSDLIITFNEDTPCYLGYRNDANPSASFVIRPYIISDKVNGISNIIAPSEVVTASENHSVGDVFICGGKLLRATSAIASGETISTLTGGNAETISLADYIAEQVTEIAGLQTDVNALKALPTPPNDFLLKKLGFVDFTYTNTSYGTIKMESNVLTASGGTGTTYCHVNLLGTHRAKTGAWSSYTPQPEDFVDIDAWWKADNSIHARKFCLRTTGSNSSGEGNLRVVLAKNNGDDTFTYKYVTIGNARANLGLLDGSPVDLHDWDKISIVLSSMSRPYKLTTYFYIEDGDGGNYNLNNM